MAEIHQLFAPRASYDPDRLKVLGNAFDDAWQNLASHVGEAPAEVDATRAALATLILRLPCIETADAESIKNAALQIMLSALRIVEEIPSSALRIPSRVTPPAKAR